MIRAFFLALCLSLIAIASAEAPRIERDLSTGWKFIRQEVPGAEVVGFDDHGWKSVDLPHTWNAEDGADGGTYYRGPGWYRLHLDIPSHLLSRSMYLRFGAASLVARVYVNGQLAGSHEGGFGAFCFEITKLVRGGDNIVAVRVDNSPNKNVAPLSGDFTVYGGLYRKVEFMALNPLSIDPMHDAGPGVYLTPRLFGADASINVQTQFRCSRTKDTMVEYRTTIFDARNHQVATQSANVWLAGSSAGATGMAVTIPEAHLWNGVSDPYLYHARVEFIEAGQVLDRVEQTFGVRTFRVDPEKGLFLNGKPYDMHGVNVHQGRPSVGWAASQSMQEEDYGIVHELGCTGVRMPHYQHADYEYTLCDRYGLVVWAELALVNHVTDSLEFYANAKQQLRELIHQNYNHPSILFWSLYNEPAVDRSRGDNEWRLVKELNDLAHILDMTRMTTGAASIGVKQPLDWYMDLGSFNRYWGWYDGEASQWAAGIDKMRKDADGRSFGISEYGAGASIQQHELNPKHPPVGGKWHPEEYQTLVHETAWPVLRERPWIWCKLLWVMFDFPSDTRNEGDHAGINDKGLVTGDRKTRKDAFYYYKANWSDKPFVYITDRRFNPHPAGRADIKIYTNCNSAQLFVNERSLGTMRNPEHVLVWPNVDLPAGDVEIRVVGSSGVSDTVTWRVVR